MPQSKAKLLRGNHKILGSKWKISKKKLKAKDRLPRSKQKAAIVNLSETSKDNSNEVSLNTNETFCTKKDIPHVEPICHGKLPMDREKILLEKSEQSQNNESSLTSKIYSDNSCKLSTKKTTSNININPNLGNKTKKRRKPFTYINEPQDYSLSPIVVLERLSIEKIKQCIFTNEEKSDTFNCSKIIGNDLSTQISENINPTKRRKRTLHRSCPRRKLLSNSKSGNESLIQTVNSVGQETKTNETTVNFEEKSDEKLIYKKAINKDNTEEIKVVGNKQSQNKHVIDTGQGDPKNENNVNTYENESNSKRTTEFEINEKPKNISVSQITRKASLRQKNQKASNSVNLSISASVNHKSKKDSEDRISKNEKRLTENTNERIQKTSTSGNSKTEHSNDKYQIESVNEKNKNENENKNEKNKLKTVDKKFEKGQNSTVTNKKILSVSVTKKNIANTSASENNLNQDKLANEKYLNKCINEECQNENESANNSEKQTENTTCRDEQNFYENITIKSEIESDDAESSEENEILNIKIFEMDDSININEEDLLLSQLKKSMRVESEPLNNNEVVKVKIFQIDKPLDIQNCSNQFSFKETFEDQNETESTITDNELIKTKLKGTKEKKLVDSIEKDISKIVTNNSDSEKTTSSDQSTDDKSKDFEEKTLTDICAKVDKQEKTGRLKGIEETEIESSTLTNKVVIKVKIVKIDKPLEIEDGLTPSCMNKTTNDKIEGEKITSDLSYILNSNSKPMDVNKKGVSKPGKRKIEAEETTKTNELSKGKSKRIKEKTLINSCTKNVELEKTTNCKQLSDDNSKEITEKNVNENCSKIYDQEKHVSKKICLRENEKMEVENESLINNEVVKIKIFENDKTLNIEDFLEEPQKEKPLKDKIQVKTANSIELNNDKLKYTEEKTLINSGAKCARKIRKEKTEGKQISTINNDTKEKTLTNSDTKSANTVSKHVEEEKKLTDSRAKNFIQSIQNKIKVLKTTNSQNSSSSESNCSGKIELIDSFSNIIHKTGKIKTDSSKNSSKLNKEKLTDNSPEKNISIAVGDKTGTENRTEETESRTALSEPKSKTIKKKKLEAEKNLKTVQNKEAENNLKTVQNKEAEKNLKTVQNKEAEKNLKTVQNKEETEKNLKIVQNKEEAEKSGNSNELREAKTNVTAEKLLINSCVTSIHTALKDQTVKGNVLSEGKNSNELSNERPKATEEISENDYDLKSSNTDKDKNETGKTTENKVLSNRSLEDTNNKTLPDSPAKSVNKIIKDKIPSEKARIDNDLHNKKLNDDKEKVAGDHCIKIVNKDVKKKVETEKSTSSNDFSKDNSKTHKEIVESIDTADKKLPDSSRKSAKYKNVGKIIKDKILSEKATIDNDLHNKKLNDDKEKVAGDHCIKIVNEDVKKKVETEKSTSSNDFSKDNSRTHKEIVESIDTADKKLPDLSHKSAKCKSVGKIIKDKIQSEKTTIDNDLRNKKLNDDKEKVADDHCIKIVNENVKKKVETEKSTSCNDFSNDNSRTHKEIVESIDTADKKLPDSSHKSAKCKSVGKIIKDKIQSEKTTIDNDLHNKKLNDDKEKVAGAHCIKIVNENVKKKETEKSTSSNDFSKDNSRTHMEIVESIDTADKKLSDSSHKSAKCKSVGKIIKDKIPSEKTTIDNDLHNKKLNDDKEKVAGDHCIKIVNENVKKKVETEKSTSSNDFIKDNSRTHKEIVESIDTADKKLSDSSHKSAKCKSVGKIIKDKIQSEKTTIDNDLHNKKLNDDKEKVAGDHCIKIVNENVKKKETEKSTSSNDFSKDNSRTHKEIVESIDSADKKLPDLSHKSAKCKSVGKIIKDKVQSEKTTIDNDLHNKKLDGHKEKVAGDHCIKIVNENVKKKVETEKSTSSNDFSNDNSKTRKKIVESIDTAYKKLPDSSRKSANSFDKTITGTIDVDKTTTGNDLLNKKQINVKEKVEIECSLSTVSKSGKNKMETEKTANSNDKDKSEEEKVLKNVQNKDNTEVEVEETAINNDLHHKKFDNDKDKDVVDSYVEIITERGKDKIETDKTTSGKDLSDDKSRASKEKALIDSCEKNDNKIMKDKTEEEISLLNESNSEDTNKKILENSCSMSVSNTKRDKMETEKTSTSSDVSNDKLKNTEEKLSLDSSVKIPNKIIEDNKEAEKSIGSKESRVDKSKDAKEKSVISIDSCAKKDNEIVNNQFEEDTTDHNELSNEKPKEVEKESLLNICSKMIEENVSRTKTNHELSKVPQNIEEKTLPDSTTEVDVPEKNIHSQENKEIEVENHKELPAHQENNVVTACTLNNVSTVVKPSKKQNRKKRVNKYRRLKKHMIRKRKKKNRVIIRSNELVKTNSSKMMELLGTICFNKIQDRSRYSEEVVKPRNKKCQTARSGHTTKSILRDPITGKFLSKKSVNYKALQAFRKTLPKNSVTDQPEMTRIVSNALTPSKLIPDSNKTSWNSPASYSISKRLKGPDTRRNTSSNQLSNSRGKDNFSIEYRTSTSTLENVVQDEITIEEHEIKIEEDPEILEIISEEESSNVNYVTASEIFSGINSKANQNTSKAAFLKNVRSIVPPSSLLRSNCTNVNNEQNMLEFNEEMDEVGNTNRNFHRYSELPSRGSLSSHQLYNQDSSDISINNSSSDLLYNNTRRNNYQSINRSNHSFDESVADTSANSNNTMSISVREAYEKISLDLLGAYDLQSEIDTQGYSNEINDLLHISDSDDEHLSDNNVDSDHNFGHSIFEQHNYPPFAGANRATADNHSSSLNRKPKKKKVSVDETLHMLLQCPRCFAECLGMRRLQRHFSRCGTPAMFTCTVCQTKLKQKRSLTNHYLSYHSDLYNEDTVHHVVNDTIRQSVDSRNALMSSVHYTMPSHVSVFCDKCKVRYSTVPESHKLSCRHCRRPVMYCCEKCSRRQVLTLRVQIHVQAKCAEEPSCPHCEHVATSPSRLHEHVLRHHTDIPPEDFLYCRYGCGLSFRLADSRQKHEAHCAKEKDQLCRFCPFKTKHRSVIRVHMQQHMVNKEVSQKQAAVIDRKVDDISNLIEAYCQACRGVFESAVSSGTRCPRCHGGALYRCRRCGEADTVYREMRRHVGQLHIQSAPRGRPPLANWVCTKCDEHFSDVVAFRQHLREIGGCRPSCRRCSKTFLNSGSLKRHVQTSCGVPPRLQCEHCPFITRNRFSIVRHMQAIHAEVYNGSTLECPGCGSSFNNIYVYDNHVKGCQESAQL